MRLNWIAYGGLTALVLAGGMAWYRQRNEAEGSDPVRGRLSEPDSIPVETPDFNNGSEAADYFRKDLQFFRRKLDAFVGMANRHGEGRILKEVDELLKLMEQATRRIQHNGEEGVSTYR